MDKIRPMLAYSTPVTAQDLDWGHGPYWISPKLDGVRNLMIDSVCMSRTLKPIPNRHIQSMLADSRLNGFDGELVVGLPTAPDCINTTTSGVMSRDGEPLFSYHVFDLWDTPNVMYRQRKATLATRARELIAEGYPLYIVQQVLCRTVAQVEEAIGRNYELGYEGSIIRCFDGRYKYNRSTLKEPLLLKVKESEDSEMEVTGFVEMEHNNNEAKLDERGFTKRTTHKANKTGAGTLGKLLGRDLKTGKPVTVGPGKMTAKERQHVWDNQHLYLKKISKYRFGKHGVLDLPRFPRHIVWRDPIDI